MARKIGVGLLGLLAFSLPFEWRTAVAAVGPLTITNVELLLGAVLLFGLVTWVRGERRPLPRYWGWLGLFGLLAGAGALAAPTHQANALKAALRLGSGILLAWAAYQLVRTRRDTIWPAAALLAGGTVAVLPGMVESVFNRPLPLLAYFRETPTVVGQFIRLTGTFAYANQAAMFIEGTISFWLVFLVYFALRPSPKKRNLFWAGLMGLGALLFLQASFMTLSRASWVTIGLVSVIMFLLAQGRSVRRVWLGLATAVAVLFLVNTTLSDVFRFRLQSEADNSWYDLHMAAPETLTMRGGATAVVPLTVTNNGLLTWRSDLARPINLGAYWLDAESGQEISQPRWPFPRPIPPGGTETLSIPVQAPEQPGRYLLQWDVVQEEVVWFGEKNGRKQITRVTVTQPVETAPPASLASDDEEEIAKRYPLPIPGRRVLWAVAFDLWRERPLLGIGLDNFRLTYGEALGAETWNRTIHTNNWYIEMLVSVGLLSSLPFFIWLALLCLDFMHTIRAKNNGLRSENNRQASILNLHASPTLWQMAIAAGIFAFLIHGLLDFFLLFNATGLLFWLLVGLWLAVKEPYADRL